MRPRIGLPPRPHAALGAALGGPVPPSHARARLGGRSARYRVLRGIYARLRPTYAMPTPYKHAATAYHARQPRAAPITVRRIPTRGVKRLLELDASEVPPEGLSLIHI